ncbi:PAS domain S-box protein [Bacillus sp. Marseille-P3661]|uniref:PAS domain S-box protein n=1 Tax=Bacillus sp. Marseille-P3661 TaxID=1936234 RepID=UPI000C838AE8|nr:PAS domain S-box protein [Bacillus sp. Marseille-P3661]
MEPKLFESSPVPMFIYKETIIKANDAFIELTGFKINDLQIKKVWDLFEETAHEEIKHAIKCRLQNNFSNKQYELRLTTKKNDVIWVHVVNTTILYKGEYVGLAVLFNITEAKQLNDDLKYQNDLWTDIFNKNSAILLLINPEINGKIIDANLAAARFYGYSVQQLKNMTISDINILSAEEIQYKMANAENRRQNEFFFRHKLANGDIREVQVFSSVIHSRGKRLLFSIVNDITTQVMFEKELVNLNMKLEESEQRYRSLFDNNPDCCFVLNRNAILQQFNSATEIITGYRPIELINKPIHSFIEKNDQEIAYYFFSKVLEGVAERFDIRFIHKNGGLLDISLLAVPIIVEGQVTGIIAIAKDVTEQKQMEMKLVEREKRYRFITENSTDIITRIDTNGTINYISPIVNDILGYEHDELLGTSVTALIHPNDLSNVKNQIIDLKKSNHNEVVTITFQVKKLEGTFIFMETSIKAIKNTDNNLEGFIMVSRDITERKLAEEQLTKVNQILKQLSTIDGLTGIYNRRYFDKYLTDECTYGPKYSLPLSLIMFDIDYFKPYNDTYGHLKGDECLRLIAASVKDILMRSNDIFARYGGEEFAIILPGTDMNGAVTVAERIRAGIENLHIPHVTSRISDYVTVSVGVASTWVGYSNPETLIKQADTALYKAKNHGRNCVESFIELVTVK